MNRPYLSVIVLAGFWITRSMAGPTLPDSKLSAVGSATWLDQGKPWAVFSLEDINYNVAISEYIRRTGR